MSEFERIGMLHLARILLSLNGWFMLLNFCVPGIRKNYPPPDEDWISRDTRAKAKLCLLLYDATFPAMLIGTIIGQAERGWYITAVDADIAVFTVISLALTVLSVIGKCTKLNVHRNVYRMSYLVPLGVIVYYIARWGKVI